MFTDLRLLNDFLFLKNYVNLPLKKYGTVSNKQKKLLTEYIFKFLLSS
jgi:hypothetical protein